MHNRKIKDLRAFLNETLYNYEYQKIKLSDNEFAESLKLTCYFIDEKIISTIEYYQYNKAPITEIEKAKDKCKDLSILLIKYKTELTKLGINPNEQLSFKKEVNDAFDFELTENNRELRPNYLEIKKEFEDFIKIEAQENDKANNSIFINNFDNVNENDIVQYFTDKLVKKKYITESTLNEFLELAFTKEILPTKKFSFENLRTKQDIVSVFYKYYKIIAGKPYRKREKYFNLLTNYFIGFENSGIKNFKE